VELKKKQLEINPRIMKTCVTKEEFILFVGKRKRRGREKERESISSS
jgi:hypothetical protein